MTFNDVRQFIHETDTGTSKPVERNNLDKAMLAGMTCSASEMHRSRAVTGTDEMLDANIQLSETAA
ncbi:hypothetical protein AA0229_1069 [Gluconobacter cerinus NRIC 0229]|nr:hypothetical protein AA0229_1069 [Gluconobacter cerinus NRIC 0229]